MAKDTIETLNKISLNYFEINYTELFSKKSREELSNMDLSIFDESSVSSIIDVGINYDTKVEEISETLLQYAQTKLEKSKFLDFLFELGKALAHLGNWKLSEKYFNYLIELTGQENLFLDYTANSFLSLGEIYFRQAQWSKSLQVLEKAKDYFASEKFNEGLVKANNLIGAVFGEKGDFAEAEKYFDESLELLERDKRDSLLAGMVEDNIGIVNFSRSLYDEAFAYFNRALQIFDSFSVASRLSEAYFNIGLVYQKKKKFENAIVEFDNSLKHAIEAENITMLNLNLSVKASLTIDTNDYELAIAYIDKSMNLSKKINDRLTIADLYKIKGILNRKLHKKKEAEKNFQQSLFMNKELKNDFNYFETAYELGILYKEWNRKNLAFQFLSKALNYKEKIGAQKSVEEIKSELNNLL